MITFDDATEAAERHLRQMSEELGYDLAIDHGATMRGPRGWMFFWNSRQYLEDGSLSDAMLGNGPLLVDAETGTVEPQSPLVSLDEYHDVARGETA
jgi:hypothetical protein